MLTMSGFAANAVETGEWDTFSPDTLAGQVIAATAEGYTEDALFYAFILTAWGL